MALLKTIRDALRRFVSFDEGLDVAGYVAEIERHFGVRLDAAEVASAYTLRDMTDLIVRKRRENGRAITDDKVWPDLRRITSDELGVNTDELNPDIRYVEDLNC